MGISVSGVGRSEWTISFAFLVMPHLPVVALPFTAAISVCLLASPFKWLVPKEPTQCLTTV